MKQANSDGGAMPAKPASPARPKSRGRPKPEGDLPGWTNGLRQLYDQVVDEDLPDSFRDLLAQLDDKS
jgi:hypothetical protein